MIGVKLTDPFFAKAITDISADNTLFFTEKQFFYLLNKKLQKKNQVSWGFLWIVFVVASFSFFGYLGLSALLFVFLFTQMRSLKRSYSHRKNSAKYLIILGGITLVGGILFSLAINSFSSFVGSVVLGMLAIYLGTSETKRSATVNQKLLINNNQLEEWLTSWERVNNQIDKVLPAPQQQSTPIASRSASCTQLIAPDVTAYSFDRLVVCDRAEVAQMLIANDFHFENNCAILSITGYPQNIFDTTMQMLRRNPDLKVYALHDCSPTGMDVLNQLRTSPQWFRDSNVTIIDVGLLPRQIIAASRVMFIQTSSESAEAAKQLLPEIRATLSTDELEWLEAGNFVELESFSPQKLIQILNKSIANSRTLNSDDSSLFLVDDTGSSMYVSESFG
ncbi:hypothetical protein [Scytonema sp. NUACC26]|uniref:hypothetical protein n=1 Tax=Scytonema sp. NUACC26 TaxID=3140176 RepID=UPI0038B40105